MMLSNRRLGCALVVGLALGLIAGGLVIYDGATGIGSQYNFGRDGAVLWSRWATQFLGCVGLSLCASLIFLVRDTKVIALAVGASAFVASLILWLVWDDQEFSAAYPPGGVDVPRVGAFLVVYFLYGLVVAVLCVGSAWLWRRFSSTKERG